VFKKLRIKIGKSILRRRLKKTKRAKKMIGFESAKNVGVVFKTTDKKEFDEIKQFLLFLNNIGIQVFALGFVDNKKVPDFYLLSKGMNYFTRKELSFYYLPKTSTAEEFIQKKFDILVDLSTDNNFPLSYICNLSKASFKIGKLINNRDCYDLMIDTSKSNTVSALVEHIKHYTAVFTMN
jgi:hypothetical protein